MQFQLKIEHSAQKRDSEIFVKLLLFFMSILKQQWYQPDLCPPPLPSKGAIDKAGA